ncbi:Hypothetical_protein [Hexamita inflata]|uniref:Hypothetical_protein n=1 Tax=Hexamita inflata TaxID=28002 RepID=A0AA86Q9W5_9EUKA|nr:Hypothetical protein HINF_LOCUS42874 [Hexamita inflata]
MNIYVSSDTFEAFLDFQSGKTEFVLSTQLLDELEYLDCDDFTNAICIQIAQQFTIDQILQLQPSLQEITIAFLSDRNLLHIAPKLFPVQCYKYIKASFPLYIERIQQHFLNSINKQLFNSQTGIRLLSDNQSPLTTETEVSTSSVQIFTPGPDSFQILVQQCKTQYFNSILTKFVFERILSGVVRPEQIETILLEISRVQAFKIRMLWRQQHLFYCIKMLIGPFKKQHSKHSLTHTVLLEYLIINFVQQQLGC